MCLIIYKNLTKFPNRTGVGGPEQEGIKDINAFIERSGSVSNQLDYFKVDVIDSGTFITYKIGRLKERKCG